MTPESRLGNERDLLQSERLEKWADWMEAKSISCQCGKRTIEGEALESVKRGLDDAANGRVSPYDEVLRKMSNTSDGDIKAQVNRFGEVMEALLRGEEAILLMKLQERIRLQRREINTLLKSIERHKQWDTLAMEREAARKAKRAALKPGMRVADEYGVIRTVATVGVHGYTDADGGKHHIYYDSQLFSEDGSPIE